MNSVPLLACFPWPWPVRSEPVSSRGHGRGRGTWTEGGRSWGAAALRRAAEADVPGQTASETTSGGGRYLKHRPPLGSLGAVGSDTSVPDQALTTVSNSVVLRQAGARRCSGSSASARRPSRTPGTLPRSQPPPALGLTGMAANDGNSCTFGLRVRDGVVVEVAHASCRAPVRRPATEEQCRSAPSFNSVDADARARACASSPPLPAMPLVANLRRRRIRSGSADRRVFCMFRLQQVALCIGALQLQHQGVLF